MILQGLTHIILSKHQLLGFVELVILLDLARYHQAITRWWQLKDFVLFTPNPGEMIQFDEHIFSTGLVQPPTNDHLGECGHGPFSFRIVFSMQIRATKKHWLPQTSQWPKGKMIKMSNSEPLGFHHHYSLGITTPLVTIGKSIHVLWKGILYEPWRCPAVVQCRP